MSRGFATAVTFLCTFLFAGVSPSESHAGTSLNETLEGAIEAYTVALNTEDRDRRLEEFRRAERLFTRATEDGNAGAELYTNLGNAALQAEHLGPAVLAYRRALRLDPDHARATQNLAHARTLLPDWVPRPETGGLLDTFFFWHRTLSTTERSMGGAIAFALAALLLACSIRFARPSLRNLAVIPGGVWVALLASTLLDPTARAPDLAVVTADETVAHAADSALAPSPFPSALPGGTEVTVLEERSPWVRIRLANGRDAWVAESSLSRVDS
jgi:hypothetical protein